MKKTIFVLLAALVTINILAENIAPSTNLQEYYAEANGKTGDDIRTALNSKISSHTTVSYDNLRHLFKYSDTYDAKGEIIEDIYSICDPAYTTSFCTGDCGGYNREHSVPKSWFDEATPLYSDAFHLYATNCYVNSYRSNDAYGVCAEGTPCQTTGVKGKALGRSGSSTFVADNGTSYTNVGKVFEPDDKYKGDLARTYFYMVTCYRTTNFTQDGGGSTMFTYTNNTAQLSQYSIDLLMKWHREDPVSKKELIRNEVIYGNEDYNKGTYKQGNRNPFIDYPELAEYIWGNKKTQQLNIASLVSAYSQGGGCTKLATPNVAAVAGDKQVTLTWAVVDGAKNYTVTISNGVGYTTECLTDVVIGTVTISGDVCTCIITGLTNGLVYTTSVKANADNSTCDSDIDQDQVTPKADPTPVTYQIRFLNGETVLQDEMLEAGVLPVYKGATPTKAPDTQYTYTFSNWSPAIAIVTKSQDYLAQFSATPLDPTSVMVIEAPQEQVRKVMINGLLYILRGDNIYDVTGRLVK